MNRIISLTTDFGFRDWYAGTVKGVIHGIHPHATIVDITHGIPPGNIRAAAIALRASYTYFPKETLHLVVVDPGVGGSRDPIAVSTQDYVFVGPDNGVLSLALERETIMNLVRLDNDRLFLEPASHTFHARDIFAPVAARLSRDLDLKAAGTPISNYRPLPLPRPKIDSTGIQGTLVYFDQFGNGLTNIDASDLQSLRGKNWVIRCGSELNIPYRHHYAEVRVGRPLGYLGSAGVLELAVNQGSAMEVLGLHENDPIALGFNPKESGP